MIPVNEQVIRSSITKFTYQGLEQLDPTRPYLFISNHRDIMLDASLLQYVLIKNGHDSSEITFGANLMTPGVVTDLGKCNKMFRVERAGQGNIKDFYFKSGHLSEYIRYVITQKRQSVWIAQRNGRTKNGNDRTDQGIIKMFNMSMTDDKIGALAQLHIVPVSISYEWESCDILKSIELYESRFGKYIKKPGEDLNSILTGLIQPKGRVNISFCPEITEAELRRFDNCTNNEYHKRVAQLIDNRIHSAYMLTPNNYIAHDLLYGQHVYQNYYSQEQRQAFAQYMEKLNLYEISEPDVLKDFFLSIYANPVDNR
jgi:1-acyl-sn-glycerol-3-phosphate acyltransferase